MFADLPVLKWCLYLQTREKKEEIASEWILKVHYFAAKVLRTNKLDSDEVIVRKNKISQLEEKLSWGKASVYVCHQSQIHGQHSLRKTNQHFRGVNATFITQVWYTSFTRPYALLHYCLVTECHKKRVK